MELQHSTIYVWISGSGKKGTKVFLLDRVLVLKLGNIAARLQRAVPVGFLR
jgi:hypothetical protein